MVRERALLMCSIMPEAMIPGNYTMVSAAQEG